MKNKLFIYFIVVHFVIILLLQSYLIISIEIGEDKRIPILSFFKENIYNKQPLNYYSQFSGINTGYGFYGINVATNKYFIIETYKKNKLIKKENLVHFKTKNGYSRFSTICSWIYNFNVETKELETKLKNKKDKDILKNEKEIVQVIKVRKMYIEKLYKYIGKNTIKTKDYDKYIVKLITVVPPKSFDEVKDKNNVYVIQEYEFKK